MLMTGSKATGPSRRVQNEEETENFEFKLMFIEEKNDFGIKFRLDVKWRC